MSSASTIFVTDADNREVLEYDGASGAIENWYAYGLGPDEVLNQMSVASGTRQTLIPDVQGSVAGLLDSGTGSLARIGYQTYGENRPLLRAPTVTRRARETARVPLGRSGGPGFRSMPRAVVRSSASRWRQPPRAPRRTRYRSTDDVLPEIPGGSPSVVDGSVCASRLFAARVAGHLDMGQGKPRVAPTRPAACVACTRTAGASRGSVLETSRSWPTPEAEFCPGHRNERRDDHGCPTCTFLICGKSRRGPAGQYYCVALRLVRPCTRVTACSSPSA